MRELSIVRTFSGGITVGRGRNWGKKLMQTTTSYVAEIGDCGHIMHGPKRMRLMCAFRGGSYESPSNAMWRGPKSTSVSSGVFIHPAIFLPTIDMGQNLGLCPFFGNRVPI